MKGFIFSRQPELETEWGFSRVGQESPGRCQTPSCPGADRLNACRHLNQLTVRTDSMFSQLFMAVRTDFPKLCGENRLHCPKASLYRISGIKNAGFTMGSSGGTLVLQARQHLISKFISRIYLIREDVFTFFSGFCFLSPSFISHNFILQHFK